MKVIRAKRNITIPINPEKPYNNAVRLVPAGLIAIVPSNFKLPKDSYVDVCKVKIKEEKEDQ